MELSELISRAQEAIDGGNYQLAVAACTHALEAYPTCISAHRMLGEAYLEQGEIELAVQHFERTLALDPLNVVARLGLGVASEEQSDLGAAYAHYLQAWELNPALDQLRDELVRLRAALGATGRLHPTRAGLAGVYSRSGQYGRAAAEWRAVLADDPENERAQIALAETLWRQDDGAGAAAACEAVLKTAPQSARALAILAEVELRRHSVVARSIAERYRSVDPAGDVANGLAGSRPGFDVSLLVSESAPVEDFDVDAQLVEPAAESTEPAESGVSGSARPASHLAAPDLWDSLVEDLQGGSKEAGGRTGSGEIAPFVWSDGADAAGEPDNDLPALLDTAELMETPAEPAKNPAVEMPGEAAIDASAEAPGADSAADGDETAATAPGESQPVAAETQAQSEPQHQIETAQEDASAPAPSVDPDKGPERFITADGHVNLTVGWDEMDRTLAEATPTMDSLSGYDDLVAQFDAGGIAPFDAVEPGGDKAAWEPFAADELAAEAGSADPSDGSRTSSLAGDRGSGQAGDAAPAMTADALPDAIPAAPEPPLDAAQPDPATDVDSVVAASAAAVAGDRWDGIDDDLAAAIPDRSASGYTVIFRDLDTDGIDAFDLSSQEVVDPLASPDSVGAPLDFDDLLTVTSQDGTVAPGTRSVSPETATLADAGSSRAAPVGVTAGPAPVSLEAPAGDPAEAPLPRSDESGGDDFELLETHLAGIEPFAFDEMGVGADAGGTGSDGVDFWDIDDAAFDPAAYAAAPDVSTLYKAIFSDSGGETARTAEPAESPFEMAEEWLPDALDFSTDGDDDSMLDGEPLPTRADDEVSVVADDSAADFADPPAPVDASDAGLDALGEREAPAWPAFVGGTSELSDRHLELGNLFDRLRTDKAALVASGALVVDRSLASSTGPAVTTNGHRPAVLPAPVAVPVDDLVDSFDLAELRAQMRDGEITAADAATLLRGILASGVSNPLVARMLGESYLKLGRAEQAAAQFRQAMMWQSRRG